MNIIKLKDVIMQENNEVSDIFNKYLKGRYAYWIQMRYIVPFDFMRHEGYVACEEDITKLLQRVDGSYPIPYGCPYIDMFSENRCIMKYIDLEATDAANNISKFKLENDKATDENITINELKNFRTWLAQMILDIDDTRDELDDTSLTDIQKHVLQYYANEMYNDTVKYLTLLTNDISVKTVSSCGCCQTSMLSTINILPECDALDTYKKSIYNRMVEMFSDIDFWNQMPISFITKFKQYIDNIIKVGFKININKENINAYKDCTCTNTDSTTINILNRLSKSLGYIIDNNIPSHKNFIYDAFYDWASLLYEFMKW